jgi:hypothetical protein
MSYDLKEFVDNLKNIATTKKERNIRVIDRAAGMEEDQALLMFPELRMFKMENNTITLVRELFDPIVEICNDHKNKIKVNSNLIHQLQLDLDMAASKLEDTKTLKERIYD